jgi:hypothetical protein
MTYKTPHPNQKVNKKAIAWALFSQSIWLPVLLTDTQDQIATRNSDYDFSGVTANIPYQNLPKLDGFAKSSEKSTVGLLAQSPKVGETNGVILNATLPKERSIQSKTDSYDASSVSLSSPIAFSSSIRPQSIPLALNFNSSKIESRSVARPERAKEFQPSDLLRRLYSRSDLLGGQLTLGDLNEPLMPPIARAERAQSTRTGDPLSTVPQMWREPMRKALKTLSENIKPLSTPAPSKSIDLNTVEQARVIHVPSSRVKRFSEVPLALQSDGTVDILNSPDDPEVIEEIKTWSSKQQLPAKGRMAPAVVHLHPLPQQEQVPTSEKITQSNSKPTQETQTTVQPAQELAPVVQEASVPNSLPATHSAPTSPPPPPPIVESRASELPPPESVTRIAEVHSDLSIPESKGEVQ